MCALDLANRDDGRDRKVEDLRVEVDGLRAAMATRAPIEQVKGMITLAAACDPDEAFAMLVAASQRSHRKVRDLAICLVSAAAAGPACPRRDDALGRRVQTVTGRLAGRAPSSASSSTCSGMARPAGTSNAGNVSRRPLRAAAPPST